MTREAMIQSRSPLTSYPLSQGGILQRKCTSCEQHKVGSGTCAYCRSSQQAKTSTKLPVIQTKLTVGQPNDKYEKEADRVAEQVMRMPASNATQTVGTQSQPPRIKRMCVNCEEEKLQAKEVSGGAPEVTPAIASRISSFQSGGQSMPNTTRNFFESRFDQDFSHVKVHTDSLSARALDAQAYTVGRHIIFDSGRYAPETTAGKHLLAHELTHVVQQGSTNSTKPGIIRRRVNASHISCESYPRSYPIFNAIRTVDPFGIINVADTRAIQILDNTINELSSVRARVQAGAAPAWPLISDAIAVGMRDRLRLNPDDPAVWTGSGPGTIELIIRWFTNIRDLLTSGAIRYTCLGNQCEAGEWAYTLDGVSRRIHLCHPFWSDTPDNRALTLIHETAHLYYGLEDFGGGPGNAACLEQFLADANGIAILPEFVGVCTPPTP